VTADAALVAEALRVNARYVEEVVIGWDLCPWAARAWTGGEVDRRVFASPSPDAGAVVAFVGELAARPAAAIGLAIFPRVAATVGAWERFAENVRRAQSAFLVAPFHPQYRAPGEPAANAAQLVSFIRRTPDPTLQLVRATLVASLARGGRDLSAEIARDNFATVSARDPSALDRLLLDIRRDRDDSYGRLGAVGGS
jgi:hypothetical protein